MMDQQWLAMHASYMDFSVSPGPTVYLVPPSFLLIGRIISGLFLCVKKQAVMKSTCRHLERELLLEDILTLEDLPSYSLLARS